MKTRLIVVGLLAAVLLGILIFIPLYQSGEDRAPSIILFVLLSAAVGRGVDVASQISMRPAEPGARAPYLDVVWNLLASMVFAVIIYLMFQGRIIQGALFPQFTADKNDYENMLKYMSDVKPATNGDVAKALFWSFVTGYSAKFVPNLLLNVTSRTAADGARKKTGEDKD
jgi:hypothetical protein